MSAKYEARRIDNPLVGFLSNVCVTLYLTGVLARLLVTGKLNPPAPFSSLLFSKLRRRYRGYLGNLSSFGGHCFVSPVPAHLLSDKEGFSKLVVFEDGYPLAKAHTAHDEIKDLGRGRYSHWGANVYFSASDSSNPLSNGRTYSVREV
jgi:hypothetical protein